MIVDRIPGMLVSGHFAYFLFASVWKQIFPVVVSSESSHVKLGINFDCRKKEEKQREKQQPSPPFPPESASQN